MLPSINPELKNLIPPLTPEEREQLEQNIVESRRCNDPIMLWEGTIIDGHNRFEICVKHGIEFQIEEIPLATQEDAVVWILENQLCRRNLTDIARMEMSLLKMSMLQEKAQRNQAHGGRPKKEIEKGLPLVSKPKIEPMHVQEAVAADAGVSKGKLSNYLQIKNQGGPLLEKVQSGQLKVGTAHRLLKKEVQKQLNLARKMLKFIETAMPAEGYKAAHPEIHNKLVNLSANLSCAINKIGEKAMKPLEADPGLEKAMKPLKTDPRFKDLIPPLSEDELSGLEKSILSQGCRDTIKTWNNIIIDGHNRYAICQKHGLPFITQELRFRSQKDAELWILQNQLGRRNLPNAMRIKLALHMEALLEEKAKKNRKGSNGSPVHVRKAIARAAGVSERTVYKYMRIRELGTPKLLRDIEAGLANISAGYREVQGQAAGVGSGTDSGVDSGAGSGADSALEVTTRIVESIIGSEEPCDISDLYCEAAVRDNIDRIERMLGFVFDNWELIESGEDLVRVFWRLKARLERVVG